MQYKDFIWMFASGHKTHPYLSWFFNLKGASYGPKNMVILKCGYTRNCETERFTCTSLQFKYTVALVWWIWLVHADETLLNFNYVNLVQSCGVNIICTMSTNLKKVNHELLEDFINSTPKSAISLAYWIQRLS